MACSLEKIVESLEFEAESRGFVDLQKRLALLKKSGNGPLGQENLATLLFFPDTNIYSDHSNMLSSLKDFSLQELLIVSEELSLPENGKGGLYKYEGNIPQNLLIGYEDLKPLLGKFAKNEDYSSEVEHLFHCAYQYFDGKIKQLRDLTEMYPNLSKREIIGKVVSIGTEEEYKLYKKQLKLFKKENYWNLSADRILALASYAVNLASSNKIGVVITADNDFGIINELVKKEVLPLYVAECTFAKMSEKGITGFNSCEDLIPYAKAHLESSESEWKSDKNSNYCSGIIYNPITESFSFSSIPKAYAEFVRSVEEFKSGKTEMISTAAAYGLNPQQAFEKIQDSYTKRKDYQADDYDWNDFEPVELIQS